MNRPSERYSAIGAFTKIVFVQRVVARTLVTFSRTM
jgi:hypothetical protein